MKKQKKEGMDAGVRVHEKISIRYGKKKNFAWLFPFFEIALLFVFITSALMCLIRGYGIEIHEKLYIGTLIFLCTFFYGTFSIKRKLELVMFGEIILYGAGSYLYRDRISSGFAIVANRFLYMAGEYYRSEFPEFVVESETVRTDATIFLLFFSVFFVACLAYFVRNGVGHWLVVGITALFAFSPEFVGYVPGKKAMVIYMISMLAYLGSRGIVGKSKENKPKVLKWMQMKAVVFQMVMGIGVLFAFTNAFTEDMYEELVQDRTLKEAVQKVVTREYNNYIGKYIRGGPAKGGINFGQIGKAGDIEYTDECKLKITRENKYTYQPVYLRGYVGSVYTGESWEPLSEQELEPVKRLQKKTGIPVEDYAAAAMYYNFGYASTRTRGKYDILTPLDIQQTDNEVFSDGSIFASPYSKEHMVEKLKPVDEVLDIIRVENVGESLGTIFVPYYAVGGLEEKKGKFSLNQVVDVGAYSWYVSPGFQNYFEAPKNITRRVVDYDAGIDYITIRLEYVWARLYDELLAWERVLNISLFDYEKGMHEGKNVLEVYQECTGKSLEQFEAFLEEYEMNCEAQLDADSYFLFLKQAILFYLEQQDYQKFVQDTYVQVPDTVKEVLDVWFEEYPVTYDGTAQTLYSAIRAVQNHLRTANRYTLHPGVLPEGEEFVAYFLLESKKGYCVHYASAATMIFRSIGIPARYVEGYVATEKQMRDGYVDQEGMISLTDRNAHAWVEIYVNGYGWLPVEVTEGYTGGGVAEEEEVKQTETENTANPQHTDSATPTVKPGENQEEPEKPAQTPKKENVILKYMPIIKWLGVVFLLFAGIYLRKRIMDIYRKKKEEKEDANRVVRYCYRQIESILRVQNLCRKKEELRDVLERENFVLPYLDRNEWEKILAIMNKYAFSEEGVSFVDAGQVIELYHKLRDNYYKKQSFIRRIYSRYVRCL